MVFEIYTCCKNSTFTFIAILYMHVYGGRIYIKQNNNTKFTFIKAFLCIGDEAGQNVYKKQ